MAKLVFILIVVMLPLLTRSQFQNVPSVPLKTLDDRTVIAPSIIKEGQVTLMYYFDCNSRDVSDHFAYLENLAEKYNYREDIHIVAIINPSNFNQVKPYLEGNSISQLTYVDMNGEFLQSMGLATNSAYFLFGPDRAFTYYYPESLDFDADLIHDQNFPIAYNQEPTP